MKNWTLSELTFFLQKNFTTYLKPRTFWKKNGFKFIDEGAFKTVFACKINSKQVALKLLKHIQDDSDFESNEDLSNEINNWNKAKRNKCNKHLAKIISYDIQGHKKHQCKWTITEYIPSTLNEDEIDFLHSILSFTDNKRKRNSFIKKINNYIKVAETIKKLNLGDIHENNLGMKENGDLVILDYAF